LLRGFELEFSRTRIEEREDERVALVLSLVRESRLHGNGDIDVRDHVASDRDEIRLSESTILERADSIDHPVDLAFRRVVRTHHIIRSEEQVRRSAGGTERMPQTAHAVLDIFPPVRFIPDPFIIGDVHLHPHEISVPVSHDGIQDVAGSPAVVHDHP